MVNREDGPLWRLKVYLGVAADMPAFGWRTVATTATGVVITVALMLLGRHYF